MKTFKLKYKGEKQSYCVFQKKVRKHALILNSTVLTCLTPNYNEIESHISKKISVEVLFLTNDLSNNALYFDYYLNPVIRY